MAGVTIATIAAAVITDATTTTAVITRNTFSPFGPSPKSSLPSRERVFSARPRLLFDHPTVLEFQDPVHARGQRGVVGRDQGGNAGFADNQQQ